MNASLRSGSRRGFTLVELLVVISILLILAGLVFAGGQGALTKAKKVEASAVMQTLRQGIALYQSEYGKLPQLEATLPKTDVEINSEDDTDEFKTLVFTLMGSNITTSGTSIGTNPRGVAFCEFKTKSFVKGDPKQGLLATPWKGNATTPYFPYFVALDYDGDNMILYKSNPGNVSGTQLDTGKFGVDVNSSAAVWCQGPAKKLDGMTASDLVATWK